MRFCQLDSLIPILRRLRLIEINTIHFGDVALLIPSDAGMPVLDDKLLVLDSVLLEDLEEWLVATNLD